MPFPGSSHPKTPAPGNYARGRLVIVAILAAASLLLGAATATAVTLRGRQEMTVDKPSENVRDAPDGEKVGSLIRGATVQKVSQEGKWVQFRMEGWIWGPSLEGFEEEGLAEEEDGGGKGSKSAEEKRRPRPALREREQLERIKELFNVEFGAFYGVSHDKVRKQLIVRFRVADLGDMESLQRRQMEVQAAALSVLEGELEFDRIRVESNRADGGGKVGVVIAITELEYVPEAAAGEAADLETWKDHTKFSTDSGETWTEG